MAAHCCAAAQQAQALVCTAPGRQAGRQAGRKRGRQNGGGLEVQEALHLHLYSVTLSLLLPLLWWCGAAGSGKCSRCPGGTSFDEGMHSVCAM